MKATLEAPPKNVGKGPPQPPPVSASPPAGPWYAPSSLWHRKSTIIAAFSIVAILLHLVLRFGLQLDPGAHRIPLLVTLVLGGLPLLYDLLRKVLKREFLHQIQES